MYVVNNDQSSTRRKYIVKEQESNEEVEVLMLH